MESERALANTAILILHKYDDHYTGFRARGPTVLRRSLRNMETVHVPIYKTVVQNEQYVRAMYLLDEHLKVEQQAGRYLPEIGFLE